MDLYFMGLPEARIPPLELIDADKIPKVINTIIDYVSRKIIEHEYDITGNPSVNSPEYQLQQLLDQASEEVHLRYLNTSFPTHEETYGRFASCIERILKMVGNNSSISRRLKIRRNGIKRVFDMSVSDGNLDDDTF